MPIFQDLMPKDVDSLKECVKSEKTSLHAKRIGHSFAVHHRKPTSSVEADITGGSIVGSRAHTKQEVSTATSKTYKFKKGMFWFPGCCFLYRCLLTIFLSSLHTSHVVHIY